MPAWNAAGAAPGALLTGDVHLWLAAVPAELSDALDAALSPGEREFMARMTSASARRQFGTAQAALRLVLARYLTGVQPGAISFRRGEHGKPFLTEAHRSTLQFNITHSHDCVLVALSPRDEIGVDIEKIRERPAAERLAARFFGEWEQRAFAAAAPDDRMRMFFRLWTRKEAHLKATGTGLSVNLRAIDTVAPEAGGWWYHEIAPVAGYAACLAGHGGRPRVSYFELARP